MFIIISSDTMALVHVVRHAGTGRTRFVSRLRRTHTHVRAHLHAVTRAKSTHANRVCVCAYVFVCARKEESDIGSTSVLFFLPERIPPLASDPLPYPPFFEPRQDHQSASRGLLRGYATRLPPRNIAQVRVSSRYARIKVLPFALSAPSPSS